MVCMWLVGGNFDVFPYQISLTGFQYICHQALIESFRKCSNFKVIVIKPRRGSAFNTNNDRSSQLFKALLGF